MTLFRYLFLFFVCITISSLAQNNDAAAMDSLLKLAKRTQHTNIDNAIELYDTCLSYYQTQNDSGNVICSSLGLINIFSGIGNYTKAYDLAWSVFPMVQNNKYVEEWIEVLYKMVSFYLIYEQDEKANEIFYQSYNNIIEAIPSDKTKHQLYGQLFSLQSWLEAEANKNYLKAEELATKVLHHRAQIPDKSSISIGYGKMQLGELYVRMNRLQEAYPLLKEVEKEFPDPDTHINSLLYDNLGKYYMKKQVPDSAILYFEKSLKQLNKFKIHFDNKVLILNKLSELYAVQGNINKAYSCLQEAQVMNDSIFSSRSAQNKALFEIKDNYAKQLRKQKLELLENEKNILLLRSITFISLLTVLLILVVVYFSRKSRKQKLEKQLLKEKQEIELQRQKDLLEHKNKELLSSALQLIERDSLQEEIKKQLNTLEFKESNAPIINQIINSLHVNRSQKWEEFNLRFTATNHGFFEVLKEQFPALTGTDLKICAFIKLGFSSKDMAQIMGIGVEGINTTRSRLRKKMGLEREVILVDFLQELT